MCSDYVLNGRSVDLKLLYLQQHLTWLCKKMILKYISVIKSYFLPASKQMPASYSLSHVFMQANEADLDIDSNMWR